MTNIRINTEHVREAGQQFAAQGSHVTEIGQVVQRAVSSLDTATWDGVSRARAEPLLSRAAPEAAHLSEMLGALAQKLTHVADVFEEQDATAAHQLTALPWVAWGAGTLQGSMASGNPPPPDGPDFSRIDEGEGAVYTPFSGTPFVQGEGDQTDVDPNDIRQGNLGDCYLMAAMAAIATQNPDAIRRMIRTNEDGTYTVTLYRNGRPLRFWQPEFDPVEHEMPLEFPARFGGPVFALPGDEQELWPMMVERAYAQQHGGYNNIVGGWGHVAMSALTGVESEWHAPSSVSLDDLAGHFEEGHAITVSSLVDLHIGEGEGIWDIPDASDVHPLFQEGALPLREDDCLIGNHEYYITGVDPEAGTVSIQNPWGYESEPIILDYADFQSAFRRVSINPIDPIDP